MTRRTRATLLLGCLGLALLFAPRPEPRGAAGTTVARSAEPALQGLEQRAPAALGALLPGGSRVSAVLRPGAGAGGR